ncbi:MAG TPA: glycosyltransferase [Gaiellaceae bacterium]
MALDVRASTGSGPLVTVIVPVRDESGTVGEALESLARQTIGAEAIEVLVYDGGSSDATVVVCRSFSPRYPWARFAVLENPGLTVPYALNAGLAESRSEWFAVLAGRTVLSDNYLEACLAELAGAGADQPTGVGGRFVANADGAVAQSIAAAVTHPLGVGRGFRTETEATDLPHHPFAVWRREDVVRLGGFDVSLTRNQDDEFSMRAIRRGARIRLAPAAEISYRPRERYRGLAAQYFQYGLWKSAVAHRHRLFPKRSALPAAVTASVPAAVAFALRGRPVPLLMLVGGYALGGAIVARRRSANPALAGVALGLVHLAYGAGVIAGAVRPSLAGGALGQTRIR